MHITEFARVFWAAGFILTVGLLTVLLWRARWRVFPVFTAWMAFQVLRTIVLFSIYRLGSAHDYALTYWTWAWVDFGLQVGVAVEIARIVLKPTGTWVRDARAMLIGWTSAGVILAAGLAWWVSPPATGVLMVWMMRGNLFTSLVICELCVVMSMTANRLGLGWRSHVMALEQGLTGWTAIMVISTALETFWGAQRFYLSLEHVRMVAFDLAICWLMVQLWREEPERQPLSAELQSYILALHQRVEYDLRRLDA